MGAGLWVRVRKRTHFLQAILFSTEVNHPDIDFKLHISQTHTPKHTFEWRMVSGNDGDGNGDGLHFTIYQFNSQIFTQKSSKRKIFDFYAIDQMRKEAWLNNLRVYFDSKIKIYAGLGYAIH